MEIETMLHKEIEHIDTELTGMEVGSDQHKTAVDELAKLMDREIEMKKLEIEREAKKEEKTDRLIKNIMTAAGIILPVIVTVWGTKVSLKFEEEGTVTTLIGRGFINKLIPKK